jgi:hypothetical protein
MKTHCLKKHPLYTIWCNIKRRCYVEHSEMYKYYGAKGVIMCDEWKSDFKTFYDWCIGNGWQRGLEVDKDLKAPEKTGKVYSPKYCSIITKKENCRNRTKTEFLTYKEETLCFQDWAEKIGISYTLFRERIKKHGWTIEKIIENPKPIPHSFIINYNGELLSISECSRRFSISVNGIRGRLEKGWSIKDALETPPNPRYVTNKKIK